MSRRACASCGSLASETRSRGVRTVAMTASAKSCLHRRALRRSYRGALRHRANSPQLDPVDSIVRTPQ
jgi:hypothetical protein